MEHLIEPVGPSRRNKNREAPSAVEVDANLLGEAVYLLEVLGERAHFGLDPKRTRQGMAHLEQHAVLADLRPEKVLPQVGHDELQDLERRDWRVEAGLLKPRLDRVEDTDGGSGKHMERYSLRHDLGNSRLHDLPDLILTEDVRAPPVDADQVC